MSSFGCQVCGVDMATARIRIPGEPPSAAWTWEGADYVGFSAFTDFYGLVVADQECQQCTFTDRTLPEFQTTAEATVWPDHEDDAEWLPDCHSDSDSEPLEYNSDSGAGDFDCRSSNEGDFYGDPCHSDKDSSEQDGNHESTDTQYPLSELADPEPPERLPHGSWHDGSIYYGGDCHRPNRRYFGSAFWRLKAPPEHIAASSCQNVQGINGHALSLTQMKNCRNIRFLIPKPSNWTLEASDQLLEESSLFYLSGETNGSNASAGGMFRAWRPFYPVRHGLQELRMDWLNVGEGCNAYEGLFPLPVHSYCLDIYAKLSYRRLGRVDLDGLWHWREIQSDPDSYGMAKGVQVRRAEVERTRESWDQPWRHLAGDEWLAANPVEVPGVFRALEACLCRTIPEDRGKQSGAYFLGLPTELLGLVLSFLDPSDLDTVAYSCRTLSECTQPIFRAFITKDMPWFWELFESSQYPTSPDRPSTWDPLCPAGLVPPPLPAGLESVEAEDALWAQIIAEDPEMENAANASKANNRLRREEILGPYRASQETLLHEWRSFRAGVEAWIRRPQTGISSEKENVNWRRIWRLFNPTTTHCSGVRNRARIWSDCEKIFDCVALAHQTGGIESKAEVLSTKLSERLGWDENGSAHLL
ncbi:unnamed protein product [Clonostachys rosea f. rosea IK726]|uniref:Uncharacterized protein n=1 Tax=Clonostachys rosea f. rosea IK726 TaxID=1349383 RepID=A0ACA9TNS3_BIOOC|nr:unnamed protein product [Clonostachys rosea f. rosea IK726]